jgi:formylglycine-generating enzyme required for sulfatase activity
MEHDSRIPSEAPTTPLGEDPPRHTWQVSGDALASINAGTLLAGRYLLTELIGEGGTSRVFKALDQSAPLAEVAPSAIAIKVLSQDFAMAGSFAALSAHVRRLRQLTHPNIVRIFGCERHNSIVFMTMEYVPGNSTYSLLHQRGAGSPVPLESHVARGIIRSVAKALEYAHSQGVVHGDLKPGNVMVGADHCKVIDFGVTRWHGMSKSDLEAIIPPAVTPKYASPQLISGEEPEAGDDVFSLACIAYEILTGVHPFDGHAGTRSLEVSPPERPGLAPAEYTALLHALKGGREQRTASMRDFLAEFSPVPRKPFKLQWPVYLVGVVAIFAVIFFWAHRTKPASVPRAVQSQTPAPPAVETPPPEATKVGAIIQDCPTCPSMTVIPAGDFLQGASDSDRLALPLERPTHRVRIKHAFAASTTDITVDDFRRFVEATGRDMKGCDVYDGQWRGHAGASWLKPGFAQTARHPVVCVSWADAVAYADWLSAKTGHKYRLPSASEWEYAARAGSSHAPPLQSDPAGACADANVADRSAERRFPGWNAFPCADGFVYTAPVGSFRPNSFGLNDMFGNVLVWTQDCWAADYVGAPSDGSARETTACAEHELRGGSWFSPPTVVRASYRNHFASDYRTSSVGIRLVREVD